MITRYTDHAANERTFMAWIRTALAIIAFAVVLTKFDLFLHIVVIQHGTTAHDTYGMTTCLGLIFVIVGTVLFALSYRRFRIIKAAIEDQTTYATLSNHMEGLTTAVLIILGVAVLGTLICTVTS